MFRQRRRVVSAVLPTIGVEGRTEVHNRRGNPLLPVRPARRKEDGGGGAASTADSVAQKPDRQGLLPLSDAGEKGNGAQSLRRSHRAGAFLVRVQGHLRGSAAALVRVL